MTNKISIMTPDIADGAIDSRGIIISYLPSDPVVEFVYIDTKVGTTRGHHYHKEFEEYILITHGNGMYLCPQPDGSVDRILVGPGQTIHIPKNCPHTFVPLTDCKSISMLTKPWNQCAEPITRVDG
jgi:quercetin dioxygenase-like cupin family protein